MIISWLCVANSLLQSCKLGKELVSLIIACNQSAQRKRDVARFVYAYVIWLFFWLRFWSTSALYGHCILFLFLFLFLLLFLFFSCCCGRQVHCMGFASCRCCGRRCRAFVVVAVSVLVVVCITRDVLFVVTIIVMSVMHLVFVLLACVLVSRMRERIRGC